MIQVYAATNRDFTQNGDMTLINCTSCELDVTLNSTNAITLVHPIDKEGRWKYLEKECVLKVPAPNIQDQLYIVKDVMQTEDEITVTGVPLFLGTKRVLVDVRPTDANGQQALDKILEGTQFKGHSDITARYTSHLIRRQLLDAIMSDDDNSFMSRIGGELFIDNFDIYVNDRIGIDTGYRFEYNKDITSIEDNSNTSKVLTRVMPLAYGGRTIPEGFVDSPLIGAYKEIYEDVVAFDNYKLVSDFGEDEEYGENDLVFNTEDQLYAALRKAVKQLYDDGLDKPTMSITFNITTLEHMEEFKGFENLLNVGLGDRVQLHYDPLNIDVTSRITAYTYDCLKEEYSSLTVGDIVGGFVEIATSTNEKLNNILNKNGTVAGSSINGTINALNTQFKAQRDVAEKQHVRAILFEDLDPESPTFGAMSLGTMGFEIASERTEDGRGWKWSTFGTGQGFVADQIVAGVLSAVMIQNTSGTFQMDLSRDNGMIFRNNNQDAIKIKGNNIYMYDWKGNNGIVGAIQSVVESNNKIVAGVAFTHKPHGYNAISYESATNSSNAHSYITFDKYNVRATEDSPHPITIYEHVDFYGARAYFGEHCIQRTINGELGIWDSDGNYLMYFNKSKDYAGFSGDVRVNGSLSVSGTKNCVQQTDNYGVRSFYAVEDAENYLTDRSSQIFDVEIDSKGRFIRRIDLDPVFMECVNTDIDYTVEIIKQGWGDFRVLEQTRDHFIVESDCCDFTFKYVVTAKRRGFEQERLRKMEEDNEVSR
jgi:phage minor structural protein|nr:MAG TPA: tail protein [Caudoviricetes sp.]